MLSRETEVILGGDIQPVSDVLDVRHYHDPDDVEINREKQWIGRDELEAVLRTNARLPLLDEYVRSTAGDVTAPTVSSFDFAEIVTEKPTHTIKIVFADNLAIDPAAIATSNITVAGPSAVTVIEAKAAELVASPTINAEYKIVPDDGTWSANDDGTYTVSIVASEIEDTSGNALAAGVVGTFDVDLATGETMVFGSTEMAFGATTMVFGV